MFIDTDVIDYFRKEAERIGAGYQTLMNSALRSAAGMGNVSAQRDGLRDVVAEHQKAIANLGATFDAFASQQSELARQVKDTFSSTAASVAFEDSALEYIKTYAKDQEKLAEQAQKALGVNALEEMIKQSDWARKAIDDALAPLRDIKI
jgi:hypothetical protein